MAPERATPAPRRPLGRLHAAAIVGMALCALVGIGTMLAFITISWPGDLRRYVVGIFVFAVVGFMTCASLAVISAARDTYARHDTDNRDAE